MNEIFFIAILVFAVAALYSSVGHGGASGYLAILTFFAFSPIQMATSALFLNLLVAGIAWIAFTRARHFHLPLIIPFIMASIPFSFMGGALKVPPHVYGWLLAGSLIVAAFRLAMVNDSKNDEKPVIKPPNLPIALCIGSGIGLLSGIVGVGGGIFLSPIFLLMNWATAKQTAAVSAFFIWVNSFSGLAGRGFVGNFDAALLPYFLLPAFLGGWIGARFGAHTFSSLTLRRLLAIVLVVAAIKAQ